MMIHTRKIADIVAWRRRRSGDEGASALLIVMCIPVLIAALGLVVDYGGRLETENQAQWTADQAARAAGERIEVSLAQTSGVPTALDASAAVTAGESVITAEGMTGTVTISDGRVQVAVQTHYNAKILFPLSGEVTGTSSARVAYGVGTETLTGN